MSSPATYYKEQKANYTAQLSSVTQYINRIARSRLIIVILGIICGIWAARSHENGLWWLTAAMGAGFLVLVQLHQRATDRQNGIKLILSMIENELKALNGDFSSFAPGTELIDIAHSYSYDLDIYGKGSIFQMLCRTVTHDGYAALAGKLSVPAKDALDIEHKQNVIKELGSLPDLLLQFRVAGSRSEEKRGDNARVRLWLSGEDLFLNDTTAKELAIIMPLLTIACGIYAAVAEGSGPVFSLIILVNWIILGIYQKKIKKALGEIGDCEEYINKTESILNEVQDVRFENEWLQHTAATAKSSMKHIARFQSLVRLLASRENVFVGPLFNSLFLFDLYCLLRLERWRQKYSAIMLTAIDHVRELDAAVSCGVYAFNNPGNVYAAILPGGAALAATGLRHPLINKAVAVGNYVSLGAQEQFYLLTGANMTGKSTFMRTIGVCHVMTCMGLPVPAEKCAMPLTELYTSMRITDSVQDDISYFRAELNRIKTIMEHVKNSNRKCMVLLDEPLRGTNSADKQQGTRAITEALIANGAIGIVATHDTLLSDMEEVHRGKVSNYHFESRVVDNSLIFDFRLKQGVSVSNNATVLMRQMGIIS